MMRFDGQEVAEQFEKAFGRPIDTVTPAQMRFLVRMCKHVRGRCRSNAALNPYLARNFAHLKFGKEIRRGKRGQYDVLTIKDPRTQEPPTMEFEAEPEE